MGAILAVAAATRLTELSLSGLSLDESYTVAVAQRPFGEMLELFSFEANGIAYQLLVWPLLRLGESEALIRAPAALAGVLATAALYWAGRELVSRRVGLLAAAIMAVHPFAVDVSQAARYYTLTFLFVTLSVAALARAARTREPGFWLLYVLTTAAAVYSSTLALLALPATHLAVLWASRIPWRSFVQPLSRALLALGVLLVPQAALAIEAASRRDALYHLRPPDLSAAAGAAETFIVGPDATPVRATAVIAVMAAAALFSALPHMMRTVRHRGLPGTLRRGETVVVAWALAFPVIAFLISQERPIFGERYLLASFPAVCLLMAMLLATSRRRTAAFAAAVIAVLLVAPAFTRDARFSDYRAAGAFLSERRQPADPVVVIPMERLPAVAYYDSSLRTTGRRLPVEEWRDLPLPRGVSGYRLPGGYGRTPLAPPSAAAVRELATSNERLFFVFYGDELGSDATNWLERNCRFRTRRLRYLAVAWASSCRPPASERASRRSPHPQQAPPAS